MSSQVKVTREFENGIYTVTVEVLPGGTLPLDIFLYEYTGEEPTVYFSVCTLENLGRPIYEPGMDSFGVRYVRTDKAVKSFPSEAEAISFETGVIGRIEDLDTELEGNATYTKTYTIGT